MKQNYEMITVKEYMKMLDNETAQLEEKEQKIRKNVEKYMSSMNKADINAQILELLLA